MEFEFTTWDWVQATADRHSGSFWARFFIVCLCMQMSGGEKKPPPKRWLAVATTADCRFRQWSELKLRWWTQTLPRLEKRHQLLIENSSLLLVFLQYTRLYKIQKTPSVPNSESYLRILLPDLTSVLISWNTKGRPRCCSGSGCCYGSCCFLFLSTKGTMRFLPHTTWINPQSIWGGQ